MITGQLTQCGKLIARRVLVLQRNLHFQTCLKQQRQIKTLEDLNNIEDLNSVDPQLIRKLIDERTDSLNTEREMKLLKQYAEEQKLIRKTTLRPFVRPAWILFLMSSTVYMGWQLYWWYCEYDRKEEELKQEVELLEKELETASTNNDSKSWYKRLFRL